MAKEDDCFSCALVQFNDAVENKGSTGKVVCVKGSKRLNVRVIQVTATGPESGSCSKVESITCPINSEEHEVKYNFKN